MKYISEEYVPADWIELAEENDGVINIRFCHDCAYFQRASQHARSGICMLNKYAVADSHICYEDYVNEILQ